jgi:hypothetical protein
MMATVTVSCVRQAIIAALFALSLLAQPPATDLTNGAYNGRGWPRMTVSMCGFYVSGVLDGIGAARVAKDSNLYVTLTSKLTIGEYVDALDRFYAEPTDRAIPIPWAMCWVARKAAGWSEADLKEYETTLRRMVSALSEAPK